MGRGRSCTGKRKFANRQQAVAHAIRRRRKFGALAKQTWAYKCQYCQGWHVGHR